MSTDLTNLSTSNGWMQLYNSLIPIIIEVIGVGWILDTNES